MPVATKARARSEPRTSPATARRTPESPPPAAEPAAVFGDGLAFNQRQRMDGLDLLGRVPDGSAAAAFFDPQYRAVLDHLRYGNEGETRHIVRARLEQMSEETIQAFIREIARALAPSGHLFLWLDKFNLFNGFHERYDGADLVLVDLITWDKLRIGLGYRTRRRAEYLAVFQKPPKRAKGVWTRRDIPDVWEERITGRTRGHPKPVRLQAALIEAVTVEDDLVLDPAAGSYSVLAACEKTGRRFLGCDLIG